MRFVADFETTTNPEDCRVWEWGMSDIDFPENFHYGDTIEDFFEFIISTNNSYTLYFHNLKFDCEFIFYYLFRNGYEFRNSDFDNKTFTTLINDKNVIYSIKIYFRKEGKKSHTLTIYDSLKVIPLSVEQIAKDFKLEESKGKIDYHKNRPIGYQPTKDEIEYLKNDCVIVAKALSIMFEQKLDKMTVGSNALHNYKNIVTTSFFERTFPIPNYDKDIRQSYKGGFTYLNPKYKNKILKDMIVLDVNSLYPSVMYYELMPYGDPIFYNGQYENDELYPLYIQSFVCNFELKKGYIPTIQLKNNLSFMPTEYVKNSNGEDVSLCLTNVDLELFLEHYNIYNIEYKCGYKFRGSRELFKKYIDFWSDKKIQAKKDGNKSMYTISKLMLNSLYGKFSLNPIVCSKFPNYDKATDLVNYILGEKEERKPIYLPVGTFITAYARNKTIRSAQSVYNRFVYADTDSLHLIGNELPEQLDIDDVKLGYWKHECSPTKAKFLRAKSYIEFYDNKLHVTCAGMPSECHSNVTFSNFKVEAKYSGKLQQKRVRGGIILKDIDFTIKA